MYFDKHVPLADAAAEYRGIVSACAAGLRDASVGAGVLVAGLSVSGQGYWESHGGNLSYAAAVLADAPTAATLHAMSIHPYARSHWIPTTTMPWGPAGWVMPNETSDGVGLAGRLDLTAGLMRAAGMAPRLWPTEFGYTLMDNASRSSVWAHTHAAATAQSLLLMRAHAAVERFFHFCLDCSGSSSNGGTVSYALWRGLSPLPAAAAFAAAAALTDTPRFGTGVSIDLNASASAIHFAAAADAAAVGPPLDTLAVWLHGRDTSATRPLRLPPAAGARVVSGFGQALVGSDAFNASAMPHYVRVPHAAVGAVVDALREQLLHLRISGP